MTTKPTDWQGPVNSLHKESGTQSEVGATISHNTPPQGKRAPRAEPEQDIDVMECGAGIAPLQEDQAEGTNLENQKSTQVIVCISNETQEILTELEQVPKKLSEALDPQVESEESFVQSEDVFPPPPPLCDLSVEECFSSLEKEVAEWINDTEIISDPTENLMSPDCQNSQEWPQPVDRKIDSASEEMAEDSVAAEENGTQLKFIPDSFSNSEPENNTSWAAHHPSSDSNSSDDVCAVGTPPFADESEEEEGGVNMDITSCQKQCASLDVRSKSFQPPNSAKSLVFTDPQSALPAVLSTKQQEGLLPQNQCELAPMGGNQEAAQQVHGQSSPPLSAVSIEVSNQGGAASQPCGCVVAERERHNRAGERTKGEIEQTVGEEGQKESVLERNKATGQQHTEGLLKACGVSFANNRHSRMESDSCDDSQSDSGVSADFSPCSTMESSTTISTGTPTSVLKETPIEREIRRAIEREQSLRRSRGLPHPPTSPEYVDIPLGKTVLCQPPTSKSEKYQGKDRQFAGKKMQHDIHRETQREEDLVKLGKVPGFYDKGSIRQLKDRKQIFEIFQQPNDSTLTVSGKSKVTSWSSAGDISTLENQDDISLSTIGESYGDRRQSIDLLTSTQNHNSIKGGGSTKMTPKGPGFSEAKGCQVIILENNLSVPALKLCQQESDYADALDSRYPYVSSSHMGEHSGITVAQQEEEEEEMAPKENPFFKLRPSTNLVKVEQDIQEAQKREKELRKQRISLYGGTGGAKGEGGGGGGMPTRMEGKTPALSLSSLNVLTDVPDSSGRSSKGVTGPPAARQSVGKLGMWPPAPVEEANFTRPESPRTPRRKNPLVHHWESGLVNGHNE